MAKRSTTKNPDKKAAADQQMEAAVRILAGRVSVPLASGLWVIKTAGDVIRNPSPALCEMANRDKENRVLQIIQIEAKEVTED